MTAKKTADAVVSQNVPAIQEEEDEGSRTKISITVSNEVLDRLDAYRRRRGGLSRSAVFALAVDWFMDVHAITRN